MPPDRAPWTKSAKLHGVPRTARHTDIIDVAYFAWLMNQPADMPISKQVNWCVDASQGVERKPWGKDPGALLQGSSTYVFALDRVLDGEDSESECSRR